MILGAVQGVTEFIPVSSSGHLVLLQQLFKDFEQPGILFDVFLHFATFLAVAVYFRQKVKTLILAFLGLFLTRHRVTYYNNKVILWCIVIASIPTAIIGYMMEGIVEKMFSSTTIVGYALIATSLLLILSDKMKCDGKINSLKAFVIGIIQGISIIPGISRSGSTISFALFMNVKREDAAEFSFILSMPAIIGALCLQIRNIGEVDPYTFYIYSIGMIIAFCTGLFSIYIVLQLVKKANFKIFALYCLIVGIYTIVFI